MLVALLLLFALSIPTTHPAAGPPVQTRTQASVELRAAEPETQAARAQLTRPIGQAARFCDGRARHRHGFAGCHYRKRDALRPPEPSSRAQRR